MTPTAVTRITPGDAATFTVLAAILVAPRLSVKVSVAGYLPAPGDGHIRDFLPPQGAASSRIGFVRGSAQERQVRVDLLRAIAEKKAHWDALMDGEAWERPVNLIASMFAGKTAYERNIQ